jgi:acyl carrier protein
MSAIRSERVETEAEDPNIAAVSEVEAGIRDFVRNDVAYLRRPPHGAGPDTPLGDGGFWLDSVDLVEVVVACEGEFEVSFEGETDLTREALHSVRSLAELIESKRPR